MSYIDFAVAISFFLFFFAAVLMFSTNYFSNLSTIVKTSEFRSVSENLFSHFFESKGVPENWDDYSITPVKVGLMEDLYMVPIVLEEDMNSSRTNEPVTARITFDENCQNKSWNTTVRLYDEDDNEVNIEISNTSFCTGQFLNISNIIWEVNISANQIKKFYLYYSPDDNITDPGYTSLAYNTSSWIPSDRDSWTEGMTGWSRYGGSTGTPTLDTTNKIRGSGSVNITGTFNSSILGLRYDPSGNIGGKGIEIVELLPNTTNKAYKIQTTPITSPASATTEFTDNEYNKTNVSDDNRISVSAILPDIGDCSGTNTYSCNVLEPPNCIDQSFCCQDDTIFCEKRDCAGIISEDHCTPCGCDWTPDYSGTRYAHLRFTFDLSDIDKYGVDGSYIINMTYTYEGYYSKQGTETYDAYISWKNSTGWFRDQSISTTEATYNKNFTSGFSDLLDAVGLFQFGATGNVSSTGDSANITTHADFVKLNVAYEEINISNGWFIDAWIYVDDVSDLNSVKLSINDNSETISVDILNNLVSGSWYHFVKELSSDAGWSGWDSFDASNGIDYIDFYMENSTSGLTRTLKVDGLHFKKKPLTVKDFPEEQINTISSSKFDALKSISYSELKKTVGENYKFRVEIAGDSYGGNINQSVNVACHESSKILQNNNGTVSKVIAKTCVWK